VLSVDFNAGYLELDAFGKVFQTNNWKKKEGIFSQGVLLSVRNEIT